MSVLARAPWLKRLTIALAAVMTIGVLAIPSGPAAARVFVGFGIGAPIGWGYYVPPPYYGYYPYYPAYAYPGFFIGGTFGPHRHLHHHHWR